jgi:type II secretory ATPase GspE/PulE/Tfp pilus assembly ATPase PilB-like protein
MRDVRWAWVGVFVVGSFAALAPAGAAWAQDQPAEAAEDAVAAEAAEGVPAPPPPQLDKWNDTHSIPRSKSPAIHWAKLLTIWLLFLIWVRSGDWINQDTQIFDLGYGKWNVAIFFPFFAAVLLLAFPVMGLGFSYFLLAAVILPICYLGAFVPYVVIRNKVVALHERVFTPSWFRYELAQAGKKIGLKIEAERRAEYEKGAAVELMTIAAEDERTNKANLLTARQSPGYLLVKELVAHMADHHADRTLLDYSQQGVMSRQMIDGVWHNSEPMERESGDVMLAVMKVLANLEMTERRKKQSGKFGAKYNGHSYVCPVVSQGVKTGEQVIVDLLGGQRAAFKTYESLGMRQKLADQWAEWMGQDRGLLIISGLPEGGITTLTDVSLMETDRLLRDFFSIEEDKHREREIENIEVVTYSAAQGQTPATILPALIRKYPNVYVLRDFSDVGTAKILIDEVKENRLVVTNVAAKDAPEALLRMLQMKVPHREFAKTVSAVLSTRLVRKLCDACKVAYEPTPDLAQKLGLPKGKVEALYRTPKPDEKDKPCKSCRGVGYFGRTGMFELLVANDGVREVLIKQPKIDLLRKAARAAGMRPFQEEGVLLVAKGVTSLAELQRVLKQ